MGLFGRLFESKHAKFWSWFARASAGFVYPPPAYQFEEIGKRLTKVASGIAFQVGHSDDGHTLDLSADGDPALMQIVDDLHAAAPMIPGWTVRAFRHPHPPAALQVDERTLRLEHLSFVASPRGTTFEIVVFIEGLEEDPRFGHAAFVFLQAVLGEHTMTTKVGHLSFVDAETRPDAAQPVAALYEWLHAPTATAQKRANPTAAAEGPRDWAVAKLELTPGMPLMVSFRESIPAGAIPATFGQRVTVRCMYPDRGDGSGLPSTHQLEAMRALDQQLASETAILLMAKTGEGSRESTFQVSDADSFLANLARVAAGLGIDYDTDVAADPTWSLWRDAVETLALATVQRS